MNTKTNTDDRKDQLSKLPVSKLKDMAIECGYKTTMKKSDWIEYILNNQSNLKTFECYFESVVKDESVYSHILLIRMKDDNLAKEYAKEYLADYKDVEHGFIDSPIEDDSELFKKEDREEYKKAISRANFFIYGCSKEDVFQARDELKSRFIEFI